MTHNDAKAVAKEKPSRIFSAQVPEPMKIILQRAASIEQMPLPYRVPLQSPAMIKDAAEAYAAFNNSDPFAYRRMLLHLQRGLESATQVGPEYRSKIRARQIAATFKAQNAPLLPNEQLAL